MRIKLQPYDGQRIKVIARFEGYSKRIDPRRALFLYILDENHEPLCRHAWIRVNDNIDLLHLQKSDWVEMCVRVSEYQKGRRYGKSTRHLAKDYQLTCPTRVRRVDKPINQVYLETFPDEEEILDEEQENTEEGD